MFEDVFDEALRASGIEGEGVEVGGPAFGGEQAAFVKDELEALAGPGGVTGAGEGLDGSHPLLMRYLGGQEEILHPGVCGAGCGIEQDMDAARGGIADLIRIEMRDGAADLLDKLRVHVLSGGGPGHSGRAAPATRRMTRNLLCHSTPSPIRSTSNSDGRNSRRVSVVE